MSTCHACGGDGVCKTCGGSGRGKETNMHPDPWKVDERGDSDCPECDGSGKCSQCDGEGELDDD